MAMRDDARLAELLQTVGRASPGALARIVAFARRTVQAEEAKAAAEHQAWLDAAEPLEPYDWGGVEPTSLGRPVTFVEGRGAVVADDG